MTIAFTICSNNYISQAKALGDSLKKHSPNTKFFIVLADNFSSIPKEYQNTFSDFEIIEVSAIGIPNFDWMNANYDIIEFNTAIKPFFFKYLLENYSEAFKIIFLDPDIVVYSNLEYIEDKLNQFNIVFTPHLTEPILDDPDKFYIHEPDILNHGIFNLGFAAINNSEESNKFINWWCLRLTNQCKYDLCKGLFVDQLWCNLVPSFFEGVLIEKHLGMNMAYWNLQERSLSVQNGQYYVNETYPLIFFHFSTFDPSINNNIASKQNRFTLFERNDLREIYTNYKNDVFSNHFNELKQIPCKYGVKSPIPKKFIRVRATITKPFRWFVNFIEETI
jgi:hypothetical protein